MADNGIGMVNMGAELEQLNQVQAVKKLREIRNQSYEEYQNGTDNTVGISDINNLFQSLASEMTDGGYYVDMVDNNYVVSDGPLKEEFQSRLNEITDLQEVTDNDYREKLLRDEEELRKIITARVENDKTVDAASKEYEALLQRHTADVVKKNLKSFLNKGRV